MVKARPLQIRDVTVTLNATGPTREIRSRKKSRRCPLSTSLAKVNPMQSLRGPRGGLLTGHLAQFRADRLAFFTECAKTYGDVVPLRLPGRSILLFSRPDLIEQVLVAQARHFVKHFGLRMYKPILGEGLVTSEGDFWRRQRKLSARAFQPSRMAGYAREMATATSRMLDSWAVPAGGQVRDIHADLMRLTLEIACRTLFGSDASTEADRVGTAMEQALQAIEVRFSRLIPVPEWFPLPSNVRLRRAKSALDAIVTGFINARRTALQADENEGDDLLSTLLQAKETDGSAMSNEQLLDEVRTLFLAGHETTALTLTYALHLLAENADAQAALRDELSSVLAGRNPAYDDLSKLPYTRKVVLESMRLFPPADLLGREATIDCDINGFTVPKNTCVFMSQWVMHRHPRYFENPLRFQPERWTEAFERSLPRFAYFPFGGGPRVCIGQAFAMAEATLMLAMICQRLKFAPDPTFQLTLWPSITLRPRCGLRLAVQSQE